MNTIREHIKNRTFLRCYLLCGTDDYMIRLYKQKLKTAVVGEEESMNLNAFEEGEKDPLEIRDLAITAPFFAEKRMIIISDSGWFKGNHPFAGKQSRTKARHYIRQLRKSAMSRR